MSRQDEVNYLNIVSILPDKELEELYYEMSYDAMGSLSELMFENGYDERDIIEYEKYKKHICDKVRIIEKLCCERGIELYG